MAGTPYLIGSQATGVGGNGAKFGDTIIPAPSDGGPGGAFTRWGAAVTDIEFCKCYLEHGEFPTNFTTWHDTASGKRAAYCAANGIRAAICFKPSVTTPTQADQNAMVASLKAFYNLGLTDMTTLMWQEPQQNNPGFPTAAQYKALYQFNYAALAAQKGVKQVVADLIGYQASSVPAYFPGAANCDSLATDYYANEPHASKFLSIYDTLLAGTATLRPGCYEMGNSAQGSVFGPDVIVPYIVASAGTTVTVNGITGTGDPVNSMEAQALLTKAAGNSTCDWAWYEGDNNIGGPNIINTSATPPDYRIALLQQLAASVRPLRCAVPVNINPAGNGDTIWVFALATAGTVTGVSDTQGNSYLLQDKEQGQSGCTMWTFACFGAQPAAGSGNALKKNPMDVIMVDFSSGSSVQAVIAVGDTGVSSLADIVTGGSGASSPAQITGTPASSGEHGIAAWGSLAVGGAPTLGGQLTQLAQVKAGNVAYLTAGWRTLTSLSAVTVQQTMGPGTVPWAGAFVSDPSPGSPALAEEAAAADAISVGRGTGVISLSDAAGAADAFAAFPPVAENDFAGALESINVVSPGAFAAIFNDQAGNADSLAIADFETRPLAEAAGAWDGITVFTQSGPWTLVATAVSGDTVTFTVSPGELAGIDIAVGQTFQLYTSGGSLISSQIFTIVSIG